jgi:catalase
MPADGQLAGTSLVVFDAVAVVLSESGAQMLFGEGAAIDFVRDAFGHLKAIAIDKRGQALLQRSCVIPDAGVIDASEIDMFIAMVKTRQWKREPSIRTLP